MTPVWSLFPLLLLGVTAAAEDEFTLYELLAPDSDRFAITYDVTTSREGDRLLGPRDRVHRGGRAGEGQLRERPRRQAAGEDHRPPAGGPVRERAVRAGIAVMLVLAVGLPAAAQTAFHRAEQDREITYWLLSPESGQFRISHDFTVSRVTCRFVNPRNDEIHVVLKARRRP
jgi:hypothetical protein